LKSSSNQYINDIRLDIVAVDDSTNDTIYTKSFNKEQIRKEPFIINIQNTLEILPPDFIMRPFLQIKARKNISNIYKIGDTIDLRLKNRKKIQGVIKFFDGEILTIEGLGKESVIIRRTEVNGIKTCGGVGIRNGVSIYQNCKYTKLEAVKFCLVKQVQVANSNKTIGLEWKE
jgi:hypothetical protein